MYFRCKTIIIFTYTLFFRMTQVKVVCQISFIFLIKLEAVKVGRMHGGLCLEFAFRFPQVIGRSLLRSPSSNVGIIISNINFFRKNFSPTLVSLYPIKTYRVSFVCFFSTCQCYECKQMQITVKTVHYMFTFNWITWNSKMSRIFPLSDAINIICKIIFS